MTSCGAIYQNASNGSDYKQYRKDWQLRSRRSSTSTTPTSCVTERSSAGIRDSIKMSLLPNPNERYAFLYPHPVFLLSSTIMKTTGFFVLLCALFFGSVCRAADKPNVLLIVADDLGYGGLNCYGTPWLETPNIDGLCKEGMKFTLGLAAYPTCQPSRTALLSGQYGPRTGGYRVSVSTLA